MNKVLQISFYITIFLLSGRDLLAQSTLNCRTYFDNSIATRTISDTINHLKNGSFAGFGQKYTATTGKIVGVKFEAYVDNSASLDSNEVRVSIYNESGGAGLPNNPLAQKDMYVYKGTALEEYEVFFTTPVTLSASQTVFITIEQKNYTTDYVNVGRNNQSNGQNLYLNLEKSGSQWYKNIGLGDPDGDFDYYLFLIKEQTISTNFNFTKVNRKVTFTNSSTGATSYLWKFGDGNTATSTAPQYTYSADGTYNVTLVTTNGACIDSTTKQVTVTCPVVTNDFTFNQTGNYSVSFTSSVTNATAYLWTFNGTSTSTSVNPSFTFPNAGDYQVCLRATNNCDTITICKTVTIACPTVVSNFTYTNSSNISYSFTNSSTNATSYYWSFGDNTFSTSPSPNHTFAGDGDYEVCLKAKNGCDSVTYCQTISIITGIAKKSKKDYQFFVLQNPVTDKLLIENSEINTLIGLFDVLGNEVSRYVLSEGLNSIPTSSIKHNGIYFIRTLNNNSKSKTIKIIVNK